MSIFSEIKGEDSSSMMKKKIKNIREKHSINNGATSLEQEHKDD